MGWGRFLLLGDLGQQLDLSDQKAEIDRLRDEMRRSRSSTPDLNSNLRQLQNEHDEVKLYLAALVRLLVSKGILSGDELKQMVAMIDAEDGSVDGAFSGRID